MANPFAISPGGVLNMPGLGDTLSGSIAGVLQAQQEREKLRREQEEFQSKQAYFATLNEGNKLDNETKKRKLKDEERQLQAKSTGLDAFSQWAGSGARFEDAGKIVAAIKDPDTAQDFLNRVRGHLETMNQAALAKGNTADADVKVATKDEVIGQAETDAARSASQARVATATEGAQITGAQAQAREHAANARAAELALTAPAAPEPASVNAALALWTRGKMTRKQAWGAMGLDVPQGLDPNEVAPASSGGGLAGADRRRGQVAYQSASDANNNINALEDSGTFIGPYTDLIKGTKLGNMAIKETEQKLIQANRQFTQMYALFVTGQAASDPLLREIGGTMVGASNDKPGVREQKRRARQLFLTAMVSAYGEGKTASEALAVAVENGRALGLDAKRLDVLQKAQMRATNTEIKRDRERANAPIVAPSDQWSPQDIDSVLSAYDLGGGR
jgi:hypothetical protein